jgi:sugar phosphate isomerase/epimerase
VALKPNDLVLCAGTMQNVPIAERIAPIAAAGFRGSSAFTTDIIEAAAAGISPKELGKRFADAGLAIAELDMVSNWFPSATGGPGLLGITDDQAFAYADALGARSVTAVVFAAIPSPDELIESFASLCDRAVEHGLQVHLEFMPISPVATIADATAIVEGADRPNGGIMLDVWHLYRSGGTLCEVEAIAPRIFGVQLDDAPQQPEENLVEETMLHRLLPGDGDADVPAVIHALRKGGSSAPLGIEVFSETLATLEPEEIARRSFAAASRCVTESQ